MGFYDERCGLTGVSVAPGETVLVALRPAGTGYRPLTLPITGTYNRYGAIDGIESDRNAELVFRYFEDRVRDGSLVLDEQYGPAPDDLELLLGFFERNVTYPSADPPAAALDGEPVFFTLVSRPIWRTLASAYRPGTGSPSTWFADVFGDDPTARGIYDGRLAEVAPQLRDLYAVDRFVTASGSPWDRPDTEDRGMQHDEEDMAEYLREARRRFADVPLVLGALDEYHAVMKEYLA